MHLTKEPGKGNSKKVGKVKKKTDENMVLERFPCKTSSIN